MRNDLSLRGNRDLFDEAFDAMFKSPFFNVDAGAMRTDIREDKDGYTLEIEMPGYDKSDIGISFEDGYVSVSAKKNEKSEDKERGNYIRRERNVSCSRSYYVGDVNEKDIKAKFENGVLTLSFPKVQQRPDDRHIIDIQ